MLCHHIISTNIDNAEELKRFTTSQEYLHNEVRNKTKRKFVLNQITARIDLPTKKNFINSTEVSVYQIL
ncbi:unnamed protein product [Allacma fusca]|uniref:Uncharacterized protein n=1 Tax=Allacma fusca TaxID=39272 RepID=A0A8J2J3I4_9HEXA|nr:unnamed protein product [Allacma fusca]